MTLVTILICCRNGGETLPVALDSAMQQDLDSSQFEVLVVDDFSSDSTPDVILDYANRYHNVLGLRNDQWLGLPASCNRGIEAASGKYFIRLDSDDRFTASTLSAMVGPLEEGATDFVYCDRYELRENKTNISPTVDLVKTGPLNIYNLIAIGTMLRTSKLLAVGGYRSLFWEEFDLYIRYLMESNRQPYYVSLPLIYYSIHPGAMTADADAVDRGWEELLDNWDAATLRRFGSHPALEKHLEIRQELAP